MQSYSSLSVLQRQSTLPNQWICLVDEAEKNEETREITNIFEDIKFMMEWKKYGELAFLDT